MNQRLFHQTQTSAPSSARSLARPSLGPLTSVAFLFPVAVTFFGLLSGCQREEPVRVVYVPKSRSKLNQPHLNTDGISNTGPMQAPFMNRNPAPSSGPRRMFTAMIQHPAITYFFKATATPKEIDTLEPGLRQIVKDLKFDEKGSFSVPDLKLPEGWKLLDKTVAMRMATLQAPNEVEVAISNLAPGQDVLMNVNRWRGQIGLPSTTEKDLDLEKSSIGSVPVLFIDISNATKTDKEIGGEDKTGSAASTTSSAIPFVVTPPPGDWKELNPTGDVINKWEQGSGDQKVVVSVFRFGSQAGFLSYAAIWAGKAKLPKFDQDAFVKAITEKTVGGRKGEMFVWPKGDEESAMKLAIVRIVKGSSAWFIKLEGPKKKISEYMPKFEKWLDEMKASDQ